MFLHTFYTWILSNLFTPYIYLYSSMILKGNDAEIFDSRFFTERATFLASQLIIVPALFTTSMAVPVSHIEFRHIQQDKVYAMADSRAFARFFEFLFLFLIINVMEFETFLFSCPGIAAVGISIFDPLRTI